MYELNTTELNHVSGGNLVYVTEQWKHETALFEAQVFGGLIGGCAFLICALGNAGAIATIGATLGSGLVVGGIFYALSRLENVYLENNTWYQMNYYYY